MNASLADSATGSLAWGDYDGDGDLDLLMAGFAGGGPNGEILGLAKIYRNDGNDVFADIGAPLEGVINAAVAWGDYDSEGDLDALVTGHGKETFITKIYRNDGDGVFTDIDAALPGIRDGSPWHGATTITMVISICCSPVSRFRTQNLLLESTAMMAAAFSQMSGQACPVFSWHQWHGATTTTMVTWISY